MQGYRQLRTRKNDLNSNDQSKDVSHEPKGRKELGRPRARRNKSSDPENEMILQSEHSSFQQDEFMPKELQDQIRKIQESEKGNKVMRKQICYKDESSDDDMSESQISNQSKDLQKKQIGGNQALMLRNGKRPKRLKSDDEEYNEHEQRRIKRDILNMDDSFGALTFQNDEDQIDEKTGIKLNQFKYSNKTLILPSCSQWFDFEKINQLEIDQLPEYFNGQFPHKNPSSYIIHRNQIIKLYRESPNAYLSASLCRKHLATDSCSIIRLHAFLEQWGLINFNVESLLPSPFQIFQEFPELAQAAGAGALTIAQTNYLRRTMPKNQYQNLDFLIKRKAFIIHAFKQVACNGCQQLCGKHFYIKKHPIIALQNFDIKENIHFKSEKTLQFTLRNILNSYVLCIACFENNQYPKIISEDEFEYKSLIELLGFQEKEFKDEQWTQEDLQKLIEGVRLFQRDWKQISRHCFNSEKSEQACLTKFLQQDLSLKTQEGVTDNTKILNTYPTVIQDQTNPIFKELAILSRDLELLDQEQQSKEHFESKEQCLRSHEKLFQTLNQIKSKSKDIQPKLKTFLPLSLIEQIKKRAQIQTDLQIQKKQKQILKLMSLVNYYQFKKLMAKYAFFKQYWQIFDWQRKEIQDFQENLLAEKLAQVLPKCADFNGNTLKVFQTNEGASMKDSFQLLEVSNVEQSVLSEVNNS